jgi:hypothetical protein
MRAQIRGLVAIGTTILAAACSDSHGPVQDPGTFNTRKVKDGLATVEAVGASPVLKSFGALGGQIGSAAAATASAPDRLIGVIREVTGIVRPETQAALVPIIRSSTLGKTLVWDATGKKYVVSDRTGAPANGVRFVLYENDAAGQPDPAKEIGASDLTDEKAASLTSAGLRLKVTSKGTTYLDYAFDVSGSIAAVVVNVKGFMSDGTNKVDFEIATTGQLFGRGGTATVDAKLEVKAQNFTIAAKATGPAGGKPGDAKIDVTVTAGSDVLVVAAKTAAGTVDATVTANGKTFATIKGPAESPVIKGDGGRDLTTDELGALGEVFKFTAGVFEMVGGLLAPAGALLLIALGL